MGFSAETVIESFIQSAIRTAQDGMDECYSATSAQPLRAMLGSAASVLTSESARASLCTSIGRSEESVRSELLGYMSACTADARTPNSDTLHRADDIRIAVTAMIDLGPPSLPRTTVHALRRLQLVLTLGQTDDHAWLQPGALRAP